MKSTTNVQSGYLCHCLRITVEDFEEILQKNPGTDYAALKAAYGIGTMCSSCEYEAKGILVEKNLTTRRRVSAPPTLASRVKSHWKKARQALISAAGLRSDAPSRKTYYTGIFFMRYEGLESRLAVSNIKFPEREQNANGDQVTFSTSLFGEQGQKLAESRPVILRDGESRELSLAELFPDFHGDFVGSLYIDFPDLTQTGSLRPYGILTNTSSPAEARCHYHDKFGYFREPGYVQNTAPFEPGQKCWLAVSNCQDRAYESEVLLKAAGQKYAAKLSLPPMASKWIALEDLFGAGNLPPESQRSPALFWLENPQHVMVYFFWFNQSANSWMGQHH